MSISLQLEEKPTSGSGTSGSIPEVDLTVLLVNLPGLIATGLIILGRVRCGSAPKTAKVGGTAGTSLIATIVLVVLEVLLLFLVGYHSQDNPIGPWIAPTAVASLLAFLVAEQQFLKYLTTVSTLVKDKSTSEHANRFFELVGMLLVLILAGMVISFFMAHSLGVARHNQKDATTKVIAIGVLAVGVIALMLFGLFRYFLLVRSAAQGLAQVDQADLANIRLVPVFDTAPEAVAEDAVSPPVEPGIASQEDADWIERIVNEAEGGGPGQQPTI